jgi:multidrug efflux system outer membrane protein
VAHFRLAILTAVPFLAGACRMGPNYERPVVPAPAAWRDSAGANGVPDSSLANLPWWQVFGDTTLQGLVRVALRENQDLAIALGRVNEARGLLGIARYDYYPQINIGANARSVTTGDSLNFIGPVVDNSVFGLGLSLGWELDLWGRVRRVNEAAKASLLASEAGRRATILTVVSEVARAYLELRDLDLQLTLAQRQTEVRRQSLVIARARFEGGLTSELDQRQGEASLAQAEATVFQLFRRRAQKENELSVLLGRAPGAVPRGLQLLEQRFAQEVPAGVPSDLLRRRPDVQLAEEELVAANARIGAAIAERFPTISLTADIGTAATDLGSVFGSGFSLARIAGDLFGPIINRDRNGRQVDVARARTEQAAARYQQVIIGAFREVEDGLVAVRRLREEADAAGRVAAAYRRALELANLRYESGVDSYLMVLDAQRTLLDSELAEASLQRAQRVATVQLYKALGGGWDPQTDSLAIPPGRR